jgi:hypothetical protein
MFPISWLVLSLQTLTPYTDSFPYIHTHSLDLKDPFRHVKFIKDSKELCLCGIYISIFVVFEIKAKKCLNI